MLARLLTVYPAEALLKRYAEAIDKDFILKVLKQLIDLQLATSDEGIFVRPEDRGSGVGRLLLKLVQSWANERGCSEFASDAHIDNAASHAFHLSLGFEETERVVYFRKAL